MDTEPAREKQPTLTLSVDEFLHVRRQLAADHTQEILRTKLDEEIPLLVRADPDRATDILTALAGSEYTDDRDSAAIYVGALFAVRPEPAKELLSTLLQDSDEEIREKAFETLEEVTDTNTITTGDAAQLAHLYYTAHPVTKPREP